MPTHLFNMYGSNPYVSQRASASLYDQKKKEKEMFEAMERERRFAAQRESATALQQFQPEAQPSLFSGIKETVGGLFDPTSMSKGEYNKATSGPRNPFLTYEETSVPDYTPTPGTVPKDPNATDAPTGKHPGYAPDGSPLPGDNRTSVNPHGDPNDGGMGVKEGTHTEYTKSVDKSYLAAMLQSAIPQKKEAPRPFRASGGAHGGGPIPEMTQFLSAERRKKKNPALWRYTA
jgi:hypothetical protein